MQNNNLGDSMYTISVCNTGIRPVQITNIYLQIERKNFLITELQHDLINKVVFPYRIEQENMVTLQISCNKISYEFQQLMNSNVLHLSSKVFIYVTDSTGGEYKQKTGLTVQDIANSYD